MFFCVMPIHVFCQLKKIVGLFLLLCRNMSSILDMSLLSDVYIAYIYFFPFCGLPFHSLNDVFKYTKVTNCTIIFFKENAFLCVIFRKSYTTLRVYVAYYFLGLLLCHLSCVYMYPIGIDVLIWYEEGLRLIYFQSTGYPVELTLNIEKIPFVFTSCSSAMISWSDSHLPCQSTHTHADTMSV